MVEPSTLGLREKVLALLWVLTWSSPERMDSFACLATGEREEESAERWSAKTAAYLLSSSTARLNFRGLEKILRFLRGS